MVVQCSVSDLSGPNVLASADLLLYQLLRVLRPTG